MSSASCAAALAIGHERADDRADQRDHEQQDQQHRVHALPEEQNQNDRDAEEHRQRRNPADSRAAW